MIIIHSNGPEGSLQPPEPLSALLDRMAIRALDPCCEPVMRLAWPGQSDSRDAVPPCTQVAPLYPHAPDTVRFAGRFNGTSAVFCLDTDDAEVIELLCAAIDTNRQSDAYLEAQLESGDHFTLVDTEYAYGAPYRLPFHLRVF